MSALGIVLLTLSASAAPQDEKPAKDAAPWVQLTIVDVIPSMVEEFVAVQRELTARAKEAKTPWRTVSRTEVFGDTYRFFVATPMGKQLTGLVNKWNARLLDHFGNDPDFTLVATADLFSHHDRLALDRFHPGGEGYALIARRIADAM